MLSNKYIRTVTQYEFFHLLPAHIVPLRRLGKEVPVNSIAPNDLMGIKR
jgi:hypothetical protein